MSGEELLLWRQSFELDGAGAAISDRLAQHPVLPVWREGQRTEPSSSAVAGFSYRSCSPQLPSPTSTGYAFPTRNVHREPQRHCRGLRHAEGEGDSGRESGRGFVLGADEGVTLVPVLASVELNGHSVGAGARHIPLYLSERSAARARRECIAGEAAYSIEMQVVSLVHCISSTRPLAVPMQGLGGCRPAAPQGTLTLCGLDRLPPPFATWQGGMNAPPL
jgi:hypothetical protein